MELSRVVVAPKRGIRLVGKKDEILTMMQDVEEIYGGETPFSDILSYLNWGPTTIHELGCTEAFCN